MLCPKCGAEVGARASLCERCKSSSRSDSLLGGGEDINGGRAEFSGLRGKNHDADRSSGRAERDGGGSFALRLLVLGVISFVVVLLIVSLYYPADVLFSMQQISEQHEVDSIEDRYSHIVIPTGTSNREQIKNAKALFAVGDAYYVLQCFSPDWLKEPQSVRVRCYNKQGIPSNLDAEVGAVLQIYFKNASTEFTRRNVDHYALSLFRSGSRLEILRSVRAHLTDLQEIRGFQGMLLPGEAVRGTVEGSARRKIEGTERDIYWRISFGGLLQVPENS